MGALLELLESWWIHEESRDPRFNRACLPKTEPEPQVFTWFHFVKTRAYSQLKPRNRERCQPSLPRRTNWVFLFSEATAKCKLVGQNASLDMKNCVDCTNVKMCVCPRLCWATFLSGDFKIAAAVTSSKVCALLRIILRVVLFCVDSWKAGCLFTVASRCTEYENPPTILNRFS